MEPSACSSAARPSLPGPAAPAGVIARWSSLPPPGRAGLRRPPAGSARIGRRHTSQLTSAVLLRPRSAAVAAKVVAVDGTVPRVEAVVRPRSELPKVLRGWCAGRLSFHEPAPRVGRRQRSRWLGLPAVLPAATLAWPQRSGFGYAGFGDEAVDVGALTGSASARGRQPSAAMPTAERAGIRRRTDRTASLPTALAPPSSHSLVWADLWGPAWSPTFGFDF